MPVDAPQRPEALFSVTPGSHPYFNYLHFSPLNTMVPNWRRFCPPGDIWQCLETFLVVTTWGQGVTPASTGMLLNISIMRRVACPQQRIIGPKCPQHRGWETLLYYTSLLPKIPLKKKFHGFRHNFENDCFAANTKRPQANTKKLASRSQGPGKRRKSKAMVLRTLP